MKDKHQIEDNEIIDEESREIDLVDLAKRLLAEKKLILWWCLSGIILGLIVAFSIPKAWTTEVTLAPEIANDNNSTTKKLGALASMAGISSGANSSDAVSPQLYPDIVKSVPFALALLEIPLTDKDGKRSFTLEDFLENDTKSPWWSAITSAPGALISLLKGTEEEDSGPTDPKGPIKLSEDQDMYLKMMEKLITASVDEKTFVITISVTMQDPVVSAIVADSVASRLKEYVTEYRTNKARQDLYYAERLNQEAKENYYEAQNKYANYLDTHQGIVLYSAQTMRDRLENEATLAFNVFNQTSQQLQMAKAKVQEETPVYATIEPAAVPIKPSAPRKVIILAGFTFLAFVGACAWILFIRPLRAHFKDEKISSEESAGYNLNSSPKEDMEKSDPSEEKGSK